MNEILLNRKSAPTLDDINLLQAKMATLPQADLKTEHNFSGGMYSRKLFRKAGTLIVGKVHKKDHLFICAMGEIIVWTESGVKILHAGDVVETKAGTKRVTYSMLDSIGITVHKTDLTNLDEIEAELIEEDKTALFDSSNKLKKNIESLEVTL